MKRLILIFTLAITLPLFVWGLVTFKFNIGKKAGEIPRINIEIGNAPHIGPLSAPVTIVEFADFECPYCKMFHQQTLQQLLALYPNKIKFVFKHFPLTQNSSHNGELAAEASMCANDQNKFWQITDLLFENQGQLDVSNLKSLASSLDVDSTLFNDCLDTKKYYNYVQSDVSQGNLVNLYGTPTFFINGLQLNGAHPLSEFQKIIDQEFQIINGSPSPSPSPNITPETEVDDVFFTKKTNIFIQTVGKSPNISVSPSEIIAGDTYIITVNFNLQNKVKGGVSILESPINLYVNSYNLGYTNVSIPQIASNQEGANFSISGVFTAIDQVSNIKLVFDQDNVYKETDESNNEQSYSFSIKGEPNSCNGTCGSNYNCKEGFFCHQGFCRNPSCPNDKSCDCNLNLTDSHSPIPVIKQDIQIQTITPTPSDYGYITIKDPGLIPTYRPIPTTLATTPQNNSTYDYKSIVIMILAGLTASWAFVVLIKSFKK